jgi:hypothetical protein
MLAQSFRVAWTFLSMATTLSLARFDVLPLPSTKATAR